MENPPGTIIRHGTIIRVHTVIGRTPNELQLHLDKIEKHCGEIELEINIKKTKIQIFYKGRLPNHDKELSFKLNGKTLEVVKEFKYLGMIFTTQLSFSKHPESVIVKAQSKLGMVYSKFKKLQIKLSLLLRIFECYVLPSFTYGISVWFERASLSTITKANALSPNT